MESLFDFAAVLLILDAPQGLEFGFDFNVWTTGPRFKGLKLIPKGLHLYYYSTSSFTCGWFRHFKEREVVVCRWDAASENIVWIDDVEQEQRIRANVKQFDPFLAAYPISATTYTQKERNHHESWLRISNLISDKALERFLPPSGHISAMTSTSYHTVTTDTSITSDDWLAFTNTATIKSDAKGANLSNAMLDQSWLVEALIKQSYDNDESLMLAELQLSFVVFLLGQVYDGFAQWKAIVQLLCNAQGLLCSRPRFMAKFLGTQLEYIHIQKVLILP